MSYNATRRSVGSFGVFVFIETLATKHLANTLFLALFLLQRVRFLVNKVFRKAVGMLGSPILLVNSLKAVGQSQKISPKVPTSLAWLLFKTNLPMSRD